MFVQAKHIASESLFAFVCSVLPFLYDTESKSPYTNKYTHAHITFKQMVIKKEAQRLPNSSRSKHSNNSQNVTNRTSRKLGKY